MKRYKQRGETQSQTLRQENGMQESEAQAPTDTGWAPTIMQVFGENVETD